MVSQFEKIIVKFDLKNLNIELSNDFNISLVEKLAIGKVYKIHLEGDLDIDGFEKGILYLSSGSGIKKHYHYEETEEYELVSGDLVVNGVRKEKDFCENNSHEIEPVTTRTVIIYHKVKKNIKKFTMSS